MQTCVLLLLVGSEAWAAPSEKPDAATETSTHYVWSVEPIKPSSLMLNIHPDWVAFGLESGVRVSSHVWVQTFIEIDKGSVHQDFSKPGFDFLTNHHYTAWLTTGRWVFSPDARKTGFLDAGLAFQWLWQQYNTPQGKSKSQTGMTIAPALLGGYEWHIGRSNAFFKIRGGGGWNAHRQGDIEGTLNLKDYEDQKRGYFSPYTHLTEVIYQPFFYIGDVAFGFKFGAPKRSKG